MKPVTLTAWAGALYRDNNADINSLPFAEAASDHKAKSAKNIIIIV